MTRRSSSSLRRMGGVVLIEALMAILIFVLGILGMLGVSATALSAQADAQYRSEAAALVNQIAQSIWVGVDRTSAASIVTSLNAFAHQTTGSSCSFSGSAATNATATAWVAQVLTGASGAPILPGATSVMQQILVETGTFNRVTITVCWQTVNDAAPRQQTLVTLVN